MANRTDEIVLGRLFAKLALNVEAENKVCEFEEGVADALLQRCFAPRGSHGTVSYDRYNRGYRDTNSFLNQHTGGWE